MYKDAKTKVEDTKSTAWSFLVVGIIGAILLVLVDLDLFSFQLQGYMKIIMSVVMGIMFLIFITIGITSFLSIKKIDQASTARDQLLQQARDWFLENHKENMLTYAPDIDSDSDTANDADLYYPRYEKMVRLITDEYPLLHEEELEHLIEELYSDLFPEDEI